MSPSRWKGMVFICLLCVLALAACSSSGIPATGNSPLPTPTPTPGQAQRLLEAAGQKLNAARTLHGIFTVTTTAQAFSSTIKTEIWNAQPDRSRSHILQSSLAQLPAGSVIVTNGKQVWEYNPVKKVVYTGAAGGASSSALGQNQLVLTLTRTIFTHSTASPVSSSASIAGHAAYQVHISSTGQGIDIGSASLSYAGDVYLDRTTGLPLRIDLTITGMGQIRLDILNLVLNQSLPNSTFTFTPPPGTKVLPLQQIGSG